MRIKNTTINEEDEEATFVRDILAENRIYKRRNEKGEIEFSDQYSLVTIETEKDDSNKIILHYRTPNKYSQQEFRFDAEVFVECFVQGQNKRYQSKYEFVDFETSFFGTYYPEANFDVKMIFELFQVTPTNVEKCRNCRRRLKLGVRGSKVLRRLKLYSEGRKWQEGAKKRLSGHIKVEMLVQECVKRIVEIRVGGKAIGSSTEEKDLKRLKECLQKMDNAVQSAAEKCSLNGFAQYRNAYERAIKHVVSKREERKLFDEFKKSVEELQKKLW